MILGLPQQLLDTFQKTCPFECCSFNTLCYIVADKPYFSGIEGMENVKVVSPKQKQDFGSIQTTFHDSCQEIMPSGFCQYANIHQFQIIEAIHSITIGDNSFICVRDFCIDSFPKLYTLEVSYNCFSATPTCRNHLQQLQKDGVFCVKSCPCLRKIVVSSNCFDNVSHVKVSGMPL